jgi:hypothetical protein
MCVNTSCRPGAGDADGDGQEGTAATIDEHRISARHQRRRSAKVLGRLETIMLLYRSTPVDMAVAILGFLRRHPDVRSLVKTALQGKMS